MKSGDIKYAISIKNWDKLQPKMVRKHREWIRLNTSLLRDPDIIRVPVEQRWLWIALLLHAGCVGPAFLLSPSDARVLFGLRRNADFRPLRNHGFIDLSAMTDTTEETEKIDRQDNQPTLSVDIGQKKDRVKKDERFDEFWGVYPNKVKKKAARAKWVSKGLDKIADKIIEDVKYRSENDLVWLGGRICHPTTYINDERWNDEHIQTQESSGNETYSQRTKRTVENLERAEAEATGEAYDPDARHRSAF